MSKEVLITALRESGEKVVSVLGSMPAAEFEEGRYEKGWNVREILAHIASIEWTYPRLLEVARTSGTGASGSGGNRGDDGESGNREGGETPTRAARGGIDSYNQRQVEKRSEASVSELLEEFQRNRAATIAAVSSAEDELLERRIRSAGGVTGSVAQVLDFVAVAHVLQHLSDIKGS